MGQGLNSGIRDAANLAWRLALVAAGTAPDPLLDDYPAERCDQVETIVRDSVQLGGLIGITDPRDVARRDEELKRISPLPENADTNWPLRTGTCATTRRRQFGTAGPSRPRRCRRDARRPVFRTRSVHADRRGP